MDLNMNEVPRFKGHLKMVEVCKETGKRTTVLDEDNVITLQGYSELMKRITLPTNHPEIVDSYFWNIWLGDDVGNGTVFEPEAANENYDDTYQTPVYKIPHEDIVFNYVNSKTLDLGMVLDGKKILDDYFPNDVDMRYTSATLRFLNEKVFSYKRFHIRALSRFVDIEINWTITLSEVV